MQLPAQLSNTLVFALHTVRARYTKSSMAFLTRVAWDQVYVLACDSLCPQKKVDFTTCLHGVF
jgi:hypothetical protein